MTEARFIFDTSGEVTQNPNFGIGVLDLAENARRGIEEERIEALKLTFQGAQTLRRAEFLIAEGLLLEAGSEDPEIAERERLIKLPTEEFDAIKPEEVPDIERIKTQRMERRAKLEADRRKEEHVLEFMRRRGGGR